jgi:hypothetical protein
MRSIQRPHVPPLDREDDAQDAGAQRIAGRGRCLSKARRLKETCVRSDVLAGLAGTVVVACACSNGPSNLPPVLTGGGGQSLAECEVGVSCTAGDYCIAPGDAGCMYLYCGGPIWECAPDGGVPADGASPVDAPAE